MDVSFSTLTLGSCIVAQIFAELEDQRRRAQVKANPTNSFLEARRHDSYDAALARARKSEFISWASL